MKLRLTLPICLCFVLLACDRNNKPHSDWEKKPTSLTIHQTGQPDSVEYFYYYTNDALDSIIEFEPISESFLVIDTSFTPDSLYFAKHTRIVYTDFRYASYSYANLRRYRATGIIPWDASLLPTKTSIFKQRKSGGGWQLLKMLEDMVLGDRVIATTITIYDDSGKPSIARRDWQEYDTRGLITAELRQDANDLSGYRYSYRINSSGNPVRRDSKYRYAGNSKESSTIGDVVFRYENNTLVGWEKYYSGFTNKVLFQRVLLTGPSDSIAYFTCSSIGDYALTELGLRNPLQYTVDHVQQDGWSLHPPVEHVSIVLDGRKRVVQISVNDSIVQRISYFDDNSIRERTGALHFGRGCLVSTVDSMRTVRHYDEDERVIQDEIYGDEGKLTSTRTYRYEKS